MFNSNLGIQDLKEDGYSKIEIRNIINALKKELPMSVLRLSCKFMIVDGISFKSWAMKEIGKELISKDRKLKNLFKSILVRKDFQLFVDPSQKKNVRALTTY